MQEVDGINQAGLVAPKGVATEPVVVPVTVEGGEEASPSIAEAPIEQGPFPVGAKPIDQADGGAEARANVEAAASSETTPAPAVETPEHQDLAQTTVDKILSEGTPTDLEGAIGNESSAEKATSPAQAPEISAFAPKRLDVPPPRTMPDAPITPDTPASPDFASPYPLPEKPQVTAEPTPVAPQTFIDTSGLLETAPPLVIGEPHVPTTPDREATSQSEGSAEAKEPKEIVDEFLAVDPATMIKESAGMADRASFQLAVQWRDVQINIRNLRERGWSDAIIAPIVQDYKNALEAKSGEAS